YPDVNPATHAAEIIEALGADKPPPAHTPAPSIAVTTFPEATPAIKPHRRNNPDDEPDSEEPE
ncbi:MAG: hypothetical protein ABSG46_12990, partial [Candidatus Binataceae bacterium]